MYNSIFERVREASRHLNKMDVGTINKVLNALADEVEEQTSYILAENQKDLALMEQANPKYDRLKLTEDRIKGIVNDIRNVSASLILSVKYWKSVNWHQVFNFRKLRFLWV